VKSHRRIGRVLQHAVAAFVSASILLGTVAAVSAGLPPGGTFVDDDSSVHEAAIEALVAAGITFGCAEDRFCPEGTVTRGQMAAFLDRSLVLGDAAPGDRFTDDDQSIFESSIERLAGAGVTLGCNPPENSRFCPLADVTREQMASFLVRALDLPAYAGPDRFEDDNDSPHEAAIEALAAAGITVGCNPPTNSEFCPAAAVTRGEMATFLVRGLGLTRIEPPPRPSGTLSEQCAVLAPICPAIGFDGGAPTPSGGGLESVASPRTVVGSGTPASCTSAAVVSAVAVGGVVSFNCGPNHILIEMTATAKVVNANGPEVVIDGGGLVTLSGMGERRILYMNTCDPAQGWTTSHCQNQDHPRLTVQNINFIRGFVEGDQDLGGGGGAIWVRGGRFKIVNAGFFANQCDEYGTDVGGAAVRVFSQYNNLPVFVTDSTFGGAEGFGNECANGGATSSIGVSWTVTNTLFSHNNAVGKGANGASGGPGGGNGGSIYMDGNPIHLILDGVGIFDSNAREGGGAVFFVSNNYTGSVLIRDSELRRNTSDEFQTHPGMFIKGAGAPVFDNSVIE
jgi:hypothetical protein